MRGKGDGKGEGNCNCEGKGNCKGNCQCEGRCEGGEGWAEMVVEPLLVWFQETKRDLPWRKSYDPYHVWISEIMLQQTQMERGVAYFLRWIDRFPTVADVAGAGEQEILKYWEGLGYYARARNLQKAAKVLVADFDGVVPCDYVQLLTLPGIGPYTAAAVASVAGNRDVAVVDANVLRVFARLSDIGKPVKSSQVQGEIRKLTEKLLPKGRARQYNQALMDFGGLVCTPKSPRCGGCPVQTSCLAFANGTVEQRPVLAKPKKTIRLRKVAGIIRNNGQIYLQQRPQDAVWGGLWEFPGGDWSGEGGPTNSDVRAKIIADCGLSVVVNELICTVTHQYTNHKITLDCYLCDLPEMVEPILQSAVTSAWVSFDKIAEYGLPAGPRKVMEYIHASHPDLFDFTTL